MFIPLALKGTLVGGWNLVFLSSIASCKAIRLPEKCVCCGGAFESLYLARSHWSCTYPVPAWLSVSSHSLVCWIRTVPCYKSCFRSAIRLGVECHRNQ